MGFYRELLNYFLLGLVQGVTEFLPVSSDGHLVIGQTLLGLRGSHLAFDVFIHGATLLAILVYFRGRLVGLVRWSALSYVAKLALATLPVVVVATTFYPWIRRAFGEPWLVSVFLAVTGLILLSLFLCPRDHGPGSGILEPGWWTALAIGCIQSFALLPGISRSGTTIVAGIWLGLSPMAAAEFSFLLALPTLGAATLYEGYKDRAALATIGALPIALGLTVSFVVAWIVIAAFLGYLGKRGLTPFGIYRLALAAIVMVVAVLT